MLVGGVVPPCGSQAHISAVIQGNGAGEEGQVDMYYLKVQEVEWSRKMGKFFFGSSCWLLGLGLVPAVLLRWALCRLVEWEETQVCW